MPEIELRLVSIDLLETPGFQRILDTVSPDTISIGNESCYRLLPSANALRRALSILKGYRRKLVVPMLFESHFELVWETISSVVDECDVLCVNDYGLLRSLDKRCGRKIKNVTLGSGVSYSYEECPWHGHIVRDECDSVKKALLRSNIDCGWMYDVLSQYPFQFEVEVPALAGMTSSAAELQGHGIAVSVLADWVPVSCSRACHTVRHLGLDIENCERACLRRADLRPTHRWDFFQGDVQEIRQVIRDQMPDLSVWGNMIYVRNPNPDPMLSLLRGNSVIFDYRFYTSLEHLQAAVSKVREEVTRKGAA